ncbi:FtsB family cell division protein [Gordonia polyisoprenivorans]|uniref:FtsB family cell division protein n=1 Tax=Gordonia polyisoprenivorans TaxID=84595 RepID=UPI001AD761D8|nr:septum formation initiator family protein [Gordonia polyisoprenivorans]QTI70821.1 septum formation initiator family protein [Gordonia polyisoprenivorans]
MADADGRFNSERDGRRRAKRSTRDPRSAERARRAPRRSASSSRRTPVSVIETGEQEIHRDDVDSVDEIDADAIPSDDASRRASSRGSRAPRRRPTIADSVVARVRGLDAKRAVIMALVVGVVAIALAPSLRNYYQGRSEYNQVVASNEQLRQQVTYYQKKVNEQGDPAYKEAQARERLGMVRPGETGLVMMYPGDAGKQAAEQAAQKHAANPWYSNLWETVATPPDGR